MCITANYKSLDFFCFSLFEFSVVDWWMKSLSFTFWRSNRNSLLWPFSNCFVFLLLTDFRNWIVIFLCVCWKAAKANRRRCSAIASPGHRCLSTWFEGGVRHLNHHVTLTVSRYSSPCWIRGGNTHYREWFCCGLTLAGSWAPCRYSLTVPHSGMGERIGRVKVRKLMGWDKDSLIDKANAVFTSKAE